MRCCESNIVVVDSEKELNDLFLDKNKEMHDAFPVSKNVVVANYKYKENLQPIPSNLNIVIGSLCTGYARKQISLSLPLF